MFSFLKRFRGKPKEVTTEQIAQADLNSWIAQKSDQAKQACQADMEVQIPLIKTELAALTTKIEALANAKLMNPNIQERAKHFMTGNREAFMKSAEVFRNSIRFPSHPEDLKDFHSRVQEQVGIFSTAISRPFQILQEFFSNETKDIVRQIQNIEKHAAELLKLREKHKVDAIETIANTIDDMQNIQKNREQIDSEVNTITENIQKFDDDIRKIQNQISELEGSSEYHKLNELKAELQKNTIYIKQLKDEMSQRFSSIEPALKKYERITMQNQQMIRDYLKNPVETLARDRDLIILQVISAMKKEVESDRLDFKDKKKDRMIGAMNEFKPEVMNEFLKNYGSLTMQQTKLMQEIDSMDVLHKLAAARKNLKKFDDERQDMVRRRAAADAKRNASDIDSEKKSIIKLAKDSLDIELKINV